MTTSAYQDSEAAAAAGRVALAESIVAAGAAPRSGSLLARMLARSGEAESVDGAAALSPAALFRAATGRAGSAGLEGLVEVIALPGGRLTRPIREGDLLVRHHPGEAGGHVAVLADAALWRHDELAAAGLRGEGRGAGHYARVVEGGPFPHRHADGHARLITDSAGRLPANQVLLRPLLPSGEGLDMPGEEVNRRSRDYAIWVQSSLNQLMSAGLAVDGIVGTRTRAATAAFQRQKGLVADGIVGRITERAMMEAGAPPPPGFVGPLPTPPLPVPPLPIPPLPVPPGPIVPNDVVDTRIDVCAQQALLRMAGGDPGARADAGGMLAAVKGGQLAGILNHTTRAAVDLAARHGLNRFDLVPQGQDATLVLDAADPIGGPPAIVFRGVETRPGEPVPCPPRDRLDPALRRAWATFLDVQARRLAGTLGRCDLPQPIVLATASEAVPALGEPLANVIPRILCAFVPVTPAGLNPPRWAPIISRFPNPLSPLRAANAVESLIDGPATFREMVAAMRTATSREHYIYLLGWSMIDDFQLIPGDASTTVRRLLGDAASRGVQIRVMLWANPTSDTRGPVTRINALPTGAAIRDNETPNPIAAFGSHHQKVLVVRGAQGLIGFCGGLDINSDRLLPVKPKNGDPQHDDHCRIAGPAAFDLLRTFILRWDHHPDSAAIDRTRGALLGRSEPVPSPIATPAPGTSSTGATCSVRIARTFNPVTGRGPATCERDIQLLLMESIRNAQRFIYMEDQYMISRQAAAELRAAVPRLQHVTILTTASEILSGSGTLGSGGLPCVWLQRRDFIDDLTRGLSRTDLAKVRIFVLNTPPPRTPPVFGPHTYVHAKSWVFDDELAVIGSCNCNRRGFTHDSEVDAFIFDDAAPTTGLTFAQQFRMALWAEHLNTSVASVRDGVASAGLWLSPPTGARIRRYDPLADTDGLPEFVCRRAINTIDPEETCPPSRGILA